MALFPLGILSAAGAGGQVGDYELIRTEIVVGSSTGSIVFSNLGDFASTYKHLQLRGAAKTNNAGNFDLIRVRFNGDTGNNYARHALLGNGSTVSSGGVTTTSFVNFATAGNTTANVFGGFVFDVLDAYSTSKNKTTRALAGLTPSTDAEIRLSSGLWMNTGSITSLTVSPEFGSLLIAGSRFSLYGIRG
jgi:hypothetical protein